jgi:hypothetical protein
MMLDPGLRRDDGAALVASFLFLIPVTPSALLAS